MPIQHLGMKILVRCLVIVPTVVVALAACGGASPDVPEGACAYDGVHFRDGAVLDDHRAVCRDGEWVGDPALSDAERDAVVADVARALAAD